MAYLDPLEVVLSSGSCFVLREQNKKLHTCLAGIYILPHSTIQQFVLCRRRESRIGRFGAFVFYLFHLSNVFVFSCHGSGIFASDLILVSGTRNSPLAQAKVKFIHLLPASALQNSHVG
jgi:hypothetical protein